jgi:hypothetical protein
LWLIAILGSLNYAAINHRVGLNSFFSIFSKVITKGISKPT